MVRLSQPIDQWASNLDGQIDDEQTATCAVDTAIFS